MKEQLDPYPLGVLGPVPVRLVGAPENYTPPDFEQALPVRSIETETYARPRGARAGYGRRAGRDDP